MAMRYVVSVSVRAKQTMVEPINGTHLRVVVREPPVEGRANRAIIKALAAYLRIPPSRIKIVMGHASKRKLVEVS